MGFEGNGDVSTQMARDECLVDIEQSFLDFAWARAVGPDASLAMKTGSFSVAAGGSRPELFGAIDIAYAAHIIGVLDEIVEGGARQPWAELILSFQSEDGWFRAGDKQGHGVVHATAYALGALQILGADVSALKPLAGFKAEVAARPSAEAPPFALSLLDRTHFWRGSHRAGGLAAIVGSARELRVETETILGLEDPQGWLDGWWAYFEKRLDPRTGYWRLSHPLAHLGFDFLYRRRHDPALASMGGAVHLYWVSARLGKPVTYAREIIRTTAGLLRPSGLYENEPYCIDLDGNFMIGRALGDLPAGDSVYSLGEDALQRNRDAVLGWFASREPADWNRSSHKLPGAFAAVAEAERVLSPDRTRRWKDVFETTWWL